MLSDIVTAALRRFGKWRPVTMEREDMEQEAWIAGLEAQAAGIISPEEIQRLIENHLHKIFNREKRRREAEAPFNDGGLERVEQIAILRSRGMRRVRAKESAKRTTEVPRRVDRPDAGDLND